MKCPQTIQAITSKRTKCKKAQLKKPKQTEESGKAASAAWLKEKKAEEWLKKNPESGLALLNHTQWFKGEKPSANRPRLTMLRRHQKVTEPVFDTHTNAWPKRSLFH